MDADWRAVTRLGADRPDLLGGGRHDIVFAGDLAELGFVHVEVATDHAEDELAGLAHEEHGLGRPRQRHVEQVRQRLDRGGVRRLDLLDREQVLRVGRGPAEGGDLAIGGVLALRVDQDRVLAVRGEGHELFRQRTAHHPDVGADLDVFEADAGEDAVVGGFVQGVRGVEPGGVDIQRVRILHRELADADQAAAGARLVPELGLQVIDDLRQLAVGVDLAGRQVGDDFLVGHRQHQVAFGPILEPRHFRPDRVVAAAGAPEIGRMHARHQHLLAADRVHLLADDRLALAHHAVPQGQQAEEAGSQGPDHRGPHHELVAGNLDIRRGVAQGSTEEMCHPHG